MAPSARALGYFATSALLLAAASPAAEPVAGPQAHFLLDPVRGALVRAVGPELAFSPRGAPGELRVISREPTGKVWPVAVRDGTILTLVGEFADEEDIGAPIVRDSAGRVLLARGMSAAVDRVLQVDVQLSWDGRAVWVDEYTPAGPPLQGTDGPVAAATRNCLSLRIADGSISQSVQSAKLIGQISALSSDDVLMSLNSGGLMRRKGGKVLWDARAVPGGYRQICDIDVEASKVLVTDTEGGVAALDLKTGTLLWRWHAPSSSAAIRDFLRQTRTAAAMDADSKPTRDEASRLAAEGWIGHDSVDDEVLRTKYGVVDARFAPGGRVLITGNPLAPWAAILDPATQTLVGRELIDALALAGFAVAAEAFRVSGVVPGRDLLILRHGPDGASTPTVLFKAPEGWYTTPLGALNAEPSRDTWHAGG